MLGDANDFDLIFKPSWYFVDVFFSMAILLINRTFLNYLNKFYLQISVFDHCLVSRNTFPELKLTTVKFHEKFGSHSLITFLDAKVNFLTLWYHKMSILLNANYFFWVLFMMAKNQTAQSENKLSWIF